MLHSLILRWLAWSIILAPSSGHQQGRGIKDCAKRSNVTWKRPGGVSKGGEYCARKFAEMRRDGRNPYVLIDKPPDDVSFQSETVDVSWHVDFDIKQPALHDWFYKGRFPGSNELGASKWLIPPKHKQRKGETRILFFHGAAAQENALGADYSGFTAKLAKTTGYPVLAFNYPTEPAVPWPQNIRYVLPYIKHVLETGPEGPGRAGSIFFVGDSEGTLVAMQTTMMLLDPNLLHTMGFGFSSLREPSSWLAGLVLSSPVVDPTCQTPSFDWNCFDFATGRGDPDAGDCSSTPTHAQRVADCRWSYLSYFYGFAGVAAAESLSQAEAMWKERRSFFESKLVNPLRNDLKGFPPLFLLGGTRDFFYSDAPRLAQHACESGVETETFLVVGGFHSFIEYSNGCGGDEPWEEGAEAYRRMDLFMKKWTSTPRHDAFSIGDTINEASAGDRDFITLGTTGNMHTTLVLVVAALSLVTCGGVIANRQVSPRRNPFNSFMPLPHDAEAGPLHLLIDTVATDIPLSHRVHDEHYRI